MSKRRKLASEQLKIAAAQSLGFADKVQQSGWESATTQEIGHMVGEMVRRGQQVLLQNEAWLSGAGTPLTPPTTLPQAAITPKQRLGQEVAQELGLGTQFSSGNGWGGFSPRDMFRFAEGVIAKEQTGTGLQERRS